MSDCPVFRGKPELCARHGQPLPPELAVGRSGQRLPEHDLARNLICGEVFSGVGQDGVR
jgi:hypothetical protein